MTFRPVLLIAVFFLLLGSSFAVEQLTQERYTFYQINQRFAYPYTTDMGITTDLTVNQIANGRSTGLANNAVACAGDTIEVISSMRGTFA